MFSKGERRFLRETYSELLRIAELARQESVIRHCSAMLQLVALMEAGPLPALQYTGRPAPPPCKGAPARRLWNAPIPY